MSTKRRFEISSTVEDADWLGEVEENVKDLEKLLIVGDKKDLSDSNY